MKNFPQVFTDQTKDPGSSESTLQYKCQKTYM